MDLVITSASRPKYLKLCIESIKQFIHYSGKMRWILHEDIYDEEEAKEVIRLATGVFDEILIDDPPIRIGASNKKLLDIATGDFVFKVEDDTVFRREIDLNEVEEVMRKCMDINQITFPFWKLGDKKEKEFGTVNRAGKDLSLCWTWVYEPGVWRRQWILDRWVTTDRGDDIGHYLRDFKERDKQWLIRNLGSYFWGRFGEGYYYCDIGLESRYTQMRGTDGQRTLER